MKERRKITEVIVKQSAEISSIIPNEDGSLFLIDIEGKLVEHELHQGVGYLRSSGKPKILRSMVKKSDDQIGENPWKKYCLFKNKSLDLTPSNLDMRFTQGLFQSKYRQFFTNETTGKKARPSGRGFSWFRWWGLAVPRLRLV